MLRIVLVLALIQLTNFVSCRNLKHNAEPLYGESSEEDSGKVVTKEISDGSECEDGKRTYFVNVTEKMSWYSGYIYCRHKDMEFAIIGNANEYEQLVNTIKQHEDSTEDIGVWTSGYFDAKGNKYRWMTRLTPMNYTVWRPGRPGTSDNRHKCVELRKSHQYKMNDVSCIDDNFVACQTQEKSCES